jgi:hypothetical protein
LAVIVGTKLFSHGAALRRRVNLKIDVRNPLLLPPRRRAAA